MRKLCQLETLTFAMGTGGTQRPARGQPDQDWRGLVGGGAGESGEGIHLGVEAALQRTEIHAGVLRSALLRGDERR